MTRKRIFVTGANGKLGSALCELGAEPLSCDVTNFDDVMDKMDKCKPDIVIHCAGKSSPDYCETYEKASYQVNVVGTANVIDKDVFPNTDFVLISSDHIFNGKRGVYSEGDKADPINVYGFQKLAAEQLTLTCGGKVVRTSRMFDKSIFDVYDKEQPNFIYRTYAHYRHIAIGLIYYCEMFQSMPNILNISGMKSLSAYQFFSAYDTAVIPRHTEVSGNPRPYRAGLSVSKAMKLGIPLFSYLDGIKLWQ